MRMVIVDMKDCQISSILGIYLSRHLAHDPHTLKVVNTAVLNSEQSELSSPSAFTRMAPVSFATENISYPKL